MIVEKEKFITREMVRANRHKLFMFGDNLKEEGFGGQAKEMRGEPNALGVPTKKAPGMNRSDFFSDLEFDANVRHIEQALYRLAYTAIKTLVIPEDGIGTGLAKMEQYAPRTFRYLQNRLKEIEDGSN